MVEFLLILYGSISLTCACLFLSDDTFSIPTQVTAAVFGAPVLLLFFILALPVFVVYYSTKYIVKRLGIEE